MKCPVCYSPNYTKKGRNNIGNQRFKCKDCGHRFTHNTAIEGHAKILLFDIETTPMEIYTWNLYPKYIHISQIIKDWNIICWRAKWLFGTETMGACQTSEEAINRDDRRVVSKLWGLIDEADIIIAHNLIKFDRQKANSRFVEHGLLPPSPYQVVDTLAIAKREFKFSSNKLDYLCQKLGIGAKLDTDFDLWKDCLIGDKIALKNMYDYCGNDVGILEDLYLKLRPWIKSHPNVALYCEDADGRCGNCGSDEITRLHRSYYTPTGKYEVWRCDNCGAMVRSRFQGKDSDLLRTLAR